MTTPGASHPDPLHDPLHDPPHGDPPRFSTVRGIAENIVALPYQLGYQPRRSLVMVCLENDAGSRSRPIGEIRLVVRVDLDPPGGAPAVLEGLRVALDRARPDVVVLIAFEDAQLDASPLLHRAQELAAQQGALIDHAVRVRDGAWCPVAGPGQSAASWQPLPAEADVPVVADYVLSGCSPLVDRESLTRLFECGRPLLRRVVTAEIARRLATGPRRVDTEGAMLLLGRVLRAEGLDLPELPVSAVADLALGLHDVLLRDAVLARTAPGVMRLSDLPPDYADCVVQHLPLLEQVDRAAGARLAVLSSHLPDSAAVPLLTVCSYLAWWSGEGTMANVAVARALAHDPDYSMALLVDRVLQHALPPPRRGRVAGRKPSTGHGHPAA